METQDHESKQLKKRAITNGMQTMKQSKNSNNVTNGTVVTKSNANKKQASKQTQRREKKEIATIFLNKNCANIWRGIQITSNCSRLSAG